MTPGNSLPRGQTMLPEMSDSELKEVGRFASWLKSAQELLKIVEKPVLNIQAEYKVIGSALCTQVSSSPSLSLPLSSLSTIYILSRIVLDNLLIP